MASTTKCIKSQDRRLFLEALQQARGVTIVPTYRLEKLNPTRNYAKLTWKKTFKLIDVCLLIIVSVEFLQIDYVEIHAVHHSKMKKWQCWIWVRFMGFRVFQWSLLRIFRAIGLGSATPTEVFMLPKPSDVQFSVAEPSSAPTTITHGKRQ